jgi:hypothetical protein
MSEQRYFASNEKYEVELNRCSASFFGRPQADFLLLLSTQFPAWNVPNTSYTVEIGIFVAELISLTVRPSIPADLNVSKIFQFVSEAKSEASFQSRKSYK